MKDRFRDKFRDRLAQHLNSLGIGAELAERGRPEERLGQIWYGRFLGVANHSLGVIDIRDGSVRWINTARYGGKNPTWSVIFGIPDQRPFSKHKAVNIEAVAKRRRVIGEVLDVTWRGKDHHTGLAEALYSDDAVKALAKSYVQSGIILGIRSYARDFHGWTLTVDNLTGQFEPAHQDWSTIQKIANRVLSSPRAY